MKRTPGKKYKLEPKWEGPYYITKENPNHSFRLRKCDSHTELKASVHANRLKLYKDPRDHRPPPNYEQALQQKANVQNKERHKPDNIEKQNQSKQTENENKKK